MLLQDNRVAKTMLRYKSVLDLVENVDGDHAGSKILGISHLNDIILYTKTMAELPFLIPAASDLVKAPNKHESFPLTYIQQPCKDVSGEGEDCVCRSFCIVVFGIH